MQILVLGLAIAGLAATGGCRQTDEAVKAELRTQMMQRCTTDIAPQASAIPGFDSQKFCTCVTDKAIGNRSVAELKKMFEDREGTAAQGRQAGVECLAQQMPGGAPPQSAEAPAGAPASTNIAAAAPAQAEAAGAVDEDKGDQTVEDDQ